MSALACCLNEMGYYVVGSDVEEKFYTDDSLCSHNINVLVFNEGNITIDSEYVYIIGSCYNSSNIEVKKIIEYHHEYYYYNEFLETFFKGIRIGVCGTHGKTTVTKFIADMFDDKCAIIGDGSAVGKKDYKYFIFEACEYQDHFLVYSYDYLVINNVELDHPDYFSSIDSIRKSFDLASRKAKYVIAREDIVLERKSNVYYFGKGKRCFCRYSIIKEDSKGYILNIVIDNNSFIVRYPFFGKHMIENLLASLTVYYLKKRKV